MPSPVANLTATYVPEDNTVSVVWEDDDNMLATDGNFTYEVFYNISVAGILLLSNSTTVTPTDTDMNMMFSVAEFNLTISEGDFLQAGVSIDIDVVVFDSDLMERSPPESANTTVPGGERNFF